MKSTFLAAAALALFPALASAQAYKCTVNGAVVYQQQPCQGGTKLDVPPPPDPKSREGRVAIAIAKKEVFIGMTEAEVIRSWGKPDKVNRTVSRNEVSEQWIFHRDAIGDDQYLYLVNGVLRTVQSPR